MAKATENDERKTLAGDAKQFTYFLALAHVKNNKALLKIASNHKIVWFTIRIHLSSPLMLSFEQGKGLPQAKAKSFPQ